MWTWGVVVVWLCVSDGGRTRQGFTWSHNTPTAEPAAGPTQTHPPHMTTAVAEGGCVCVCAAVSVGWSGQWGFLQRSQSKDSLPHQGRQIILTQFGTMRGRLDQVSSTTQKNPRDFIFFNSNNVLLIK